jgi:polyphenol oxidase
MKIDYIQPKIFDGHNIIAGVTKRNLADFMSYGFTISSAKIADSDTVLSNRIFLANEIGINFSNMIFQKQVHGDYIRYVNSKSDDNIESDGMYSNQIGIVINISIADCAAVLIYDKNKKVICGVHSGWKGTSLNITGKAIQILKNEFVSNPDDILVYISPCAGGDKYEVGAEVAELFPRSIKPKENGKFLFDNKNEIYLQLIEEGILEKNIEISDICTISNTDFHSYRRDGDNSGRMSAFIGMSL